MKFDQWGLSDVEKSAVNFGEFPHAGKYTYKVTEVNESVANTNITYDQNTYYMDVYVENTEDGLQIANTVARDGENKTPALSFLNTYSQTGCIADGNKAYDRFRRP